MRSCSRSWPRATWGRAGWGAEFHRLHRSHDDHAPLGQLFAGADALHRRGRRFGPRRRGALAHCPDPPDRSRGGAHRGRCAGGDRRARRRAADAWLLAALAVVSSIVATVPGAVLAGLQRWRDATIAGLTTGGVGVAAAIVVLSLGGRITAMFAVEAIVTTLALLDRRTRPWRAGRAANRPALRRPAPGDGPLRHVLLRRHAPLSDRLARSEFFFLQHYSNDQQIAFYSIAYAVSTGVVRLPSAMGEVLAPAVATLFGAGAHERILDRVQPGPAPARPRDAARHSCGLRHSVRKRCG